MTAGNDQNTNTKRPGPLRNETGSSPTTSVSNAENGREEPPKEIGGRPGLDPVRYGDWEKQGRCIDF